MKRVVCVEQGVHFENHNRKTGDIYYYIAIYRDDNNNVSYKRFENGNNYERVYWNDLDEDVQNFIHKACIVDMRADDVLPINTYWYELSEKYKK